MIQFQYTDGFSVNGDMDSSGVESSVSGFESACRVLLQDIQERLVYASSNYINDQILNYAPAAGDIAYPEKLEMARSISNNQLQLQQQDSSTSDSQLLGSTMAALNPLQPVNPTSFPAIWYPTVRRTITLLCRLHRCLDRTALQGRFNNLLYSLFHLVGCNTCGNGIINF